MVSSLQNVLAEDPGFDPDNVLATTIVITPDRYPAEESRRQLLDTVLSELGSLPGVVSTASASQLPFSGMSDGGVISPEGQTTSPDESVVSHYRTTVSPGYFRTMGIPLLEGRGFSEADTHRAANMTL